MGVRRGVDPTQVSPLLSRSARAIHGHAALLNDGAYANHEGFADGISPSLLASYNGQNGAEAVSIGQAYSTDGYLWFRDPENPVLTKGSGWESNLVAQPCPVRVNNKIYLYYGGYNSANWQIGLATSTDNGKSFTKYFNNPVIALRRSGSPDQNGAHFPTVLLEPDDQDPAQRFKMWYDGSDASNKDGILYAYSADGITWTKYGVVVDWGSERSWDAGDLGIGRVTKT